VVEVSAMFLTRFQPPAMAGFILPLASCIE
jgi:hypothetical protein